MRELTVGTLVSQAVECPPGWVEVSCQFCGEKMYCQEKNSKPKPGWELVLSCPNCLASLKDGSMDKIENDLTDFEVDPWARSYKWN